MTSFTMLYVLVEHMDCENTLTSKGGKVFSPQTLFSPRFIFSSSKFLFQYRLSNGTKTRKMEEAGYWISRAFYREGI